jgi:hypothetical protein
MPDQKTIAPAAIPMRTPAGTFTKRDAPAVKAGEEGVLGEVVVKLPDGADGPADG